jgi:hypothetical protein
MEQKGIGKKLAIYVPREDEFVITALEKMIEKSRAASRINLSKRQSLV